MTSLVGSLDRIELQMFDVLGDGSPREICPAHHVSTNPGGNLACVGPGLHDLVRELAHLAVDVVDVRDLLLLALGRDEPLDELEDPDVIHVEPRHREVGIGLAVLGLLDDVDDLTIHDVRDPEPLWVRHATEMDPCTAAVLLFHEPAHYVPHVARKDVVSQDHDHNSVAREDHVGSLIERVTDATRGVVLRLVREARRLLALRHTLLGIELTATEKPLDRTPRVTTDDDELLDVVLEERVDRPADHGPVVDGKQVLVSVRGQRLHTRSQATSQHDTVDWSRRIHLF